MAFQGYLKKIEFLSNNSENECLPLQILGRQSGVFLQKNLHISLKITGIRLCTVLNQRIQEMHCLIKRVHKSLVMNSWGHKCFIKSFIWQNFT